MGASSRRHGNEAEAWVRDRLRGTPGVVYVADGNPGGPWDLCAFYDEGDTLFTFIEVKSSKVKWGCKPLTPEEAAFRDFCVATWGEGSWALVRLQRTKGGGYKPLPPYSLSLSPARRDP